MEPLITATKINHFYGSFHAVQDLSLELQRGEILGLLGPNGAGKSTSMKVITGNIIPTSGSIELDGIKISEKPLQAKARLGYLPEHPPLYHEMTIGEYLRFCAKLHKLPNSEVTSAIAESMEKCGLNGMERRLIANLSKGYQQRVGIAQAIIHKPPIIILDEPTTGLDPNQIMEIRNLIRGLGEEHGVILSTHILPEVQSLCSRVIVLNKGRIAFSDSMDNIDATPATSINIRLKKTPSPEELSSINGIADSRVLHDDRISLELDSDADTATISQQLVTKGWGLKEFTPQRQTLEQVFSRLTMDEES